MLRAEDFSTIAIVVEDGIATLTLNRPEFENRVDDKMHSELSDVFTAVHRDKSILAVVLTGAGETFCAGDDIKGLPEFGLDDGLWAAVPMLDAAGRRQAHMVKTFNDVPRDADRVIFFPRAAGGC